jgi:uncharacterized membrane protein
MQRFRLIVAAVLVVVGLLWIGQGVGLVPGSFMTREPFWAVAGCFAVAVGVFVGWATLLKRQP